MLDGSVDQRVVENDECRRGSNSASHSLAAETGSAWRCDSIIPIRQKRVELFDVEPCTTSTSSSSSAKVVSVFLMQQTEFSIGRAHADQHAVCCRQMTAASLYRSRYRVSQLIPPEGNLVENTT